YLSFPFHLFLRALLSLPTRRSSDLFLIPLYVVSSSVGSSLVFNLYNSSSICLKMSYNFGKSPPPSPLPMFLGTFKIFIFAILSRSEEHTSELQSRFDLVCRLRLEKK